MYEYAPQASNLASKGRYGDSMLVHMNPAEVGIMNAMSGGQMTINPDTGQPEAFAFLLPLLGGLAGGALGGAGLLGGLGAISAGALGTGLGKFAETGSLKKAILSGALSYGIGSLADKALGSFADTALEEGATGALDLAADSGIQAMPSLSMPGAIGTQTMGQAIDSGLRTPVDALTSRGFETFARQRPFMSVFASDPTAASFGQTGATIGSAVAPGAQALAGSFGADAVMPEYPMFDDITETYRDIPEADPPTRRVRRMPADFAVGSRGEFKFFEDPAKEKSGEARNFFPQTTAQREMRYGGSPVLLQEGGIASLPENVAVDEEVSVTEETSVDPDMRLEPEMEQDAMIFNAGVNAVMCESNTPAEDLQMFVERFGMDRLHQIICEVMEMAKGEEEIEGELTKEDKPVAMIDGGAARKDGPVDTIPASLEGKQSYLLAENEFIIPEPVVSAVGGGDPEMGARVFDKFIKEVKATV